jgi:hypothetical protein
VKAWTRILFSFANPVAAGKREWKDMVGVAAKDKLISQGLY